MNYYNEIKKELIDNELNKKIKDYSKNKYEIQKYYNVGKLLVEAGNNYGEGIIKEYSVKLTKDIGKKYSVRYLFDIKKLYLFAKVHPLGAQLTLSHYRLLFPLNNDNKIDYYKSYHIKPLEDEFELLDRGKIFYKHNTLLTILLSYYCTIRISGLQTFLC